MQVANLLATKGRDVATVSKESTVADALTILKERRVGALVVTGDTEPLVGIFSERDVVRDLAEHGVETLSRHVEDLMSSTVTVCDEATSVTDVMKLMTEHRIRHVPVVHDGKLAGIVSIGDVVKARLDELEADKRELIEYVQAR